MSGFFARLAGLEQAGHPFVLCTVVATTGSSPGRVGMRLAVLPGGATLGSIGGGALEHRATLVAPEVLRTGEAQLLDLRLDESPGGLGTACGGTAQVFIERIAARPRLVIAGGGHIGAALVEIAALAGFDCVVLDDRPDYASATRHPRAVATHAGDYVEQVQTLDLPTDSYFVIVTHQHTNDEAVMRELLRRDLAPRYVGLVGSRTKLVELYRHLAEAGIPREQLAAVHAPIGIDLGGQRAEEIALAIAAELVAARYGKVLADSLRDRARVIDKV